MNHSSGLDLGKRTETAQRIFINEVPAEDSEVISLDLDKRSRPSLQFAEMFPCFIALTYSEYIVGHKSYFSSSVQLVLTELLHYKVSKICKGLKTSPIQSKKPVFLSPETP